MGEEAYSIAICLFDAVKSAMTSNDANRLKVQIFASDISEKAIKKARTGVYSAAELRPVSEKQLADYFIRIDGQYIVIQSLRDSIVFTVHNFLKDPPFGKVDLISCRNVFIYLEPFLHNKALTTFHYALKENGYFVMDKSETIGKSINLFAPLSKNGKIYTRKDGERRYAHEPAEKKRKEHVSANKNKLSSPSQRTDFTKSAQALLVRDYTPAIGSQRIDL